MIFTNENHDVYHLSVDVHIRQTKKAIGTESSPKTVRQWRAGPLSHYFRTTESVNLGREMDKVRKTLADPIQMGPDINYY